MVEKIIKERLSECQSVMKDFEKEGAKGDIKAFDELFLQGSTHLGKIS